MRSRALGQKGGWYVADFPSEPRLAPIYAALHGSRGLHAALRRAFGGRSYRVLSRKDLYIDRDSQWHFDRLHNQYASFVPDSCAFWRLLPGGGAYRILTVGLYLQPGVAGRALTVKPATHLNTCYVKHGPHENASRFPPTPLAPPLGAAVLFDTRLLHRGQDKAFANLRLSREGEHRVLVTLNFGAKGNAFTDGYDRGFAARNADFNNESGCATDADGGIDLRCSRRAVAAELAARPLPREMQQLSEPPDDRPGLCSRMCKSRLK